MSAGTPNPYISIESVIALERQLEDVRASHDDVAAALKRAGCTIKDLKTIEVRR